MANSIIPAIADVPAEIWTQIMCDTGDFATITSLAKTCHGLNEVWKANEGTIIYNLLDSENRYQNSSYGYAACHLVENQLYFNEKEPLPTTRKHEDPDKYQPITKLFAMQLGHNTLAKNKCAAKFRKSIEKFPVLAEWETMVFSEAFYRFWLCALYVTHVQRRIHIREKPGMWIGDAQVLVGRDPNGNLPLSLDSADPTRFVDSTALVIAYLETLSAAESDAVLEAAHISDCDRCGFSFERRFTEQCWPGWPLRIRDTVFLLEKSQRVQVRPHPFDRSAVVESEQRLIFERFNYIWRHAHEMPAREARKTDWEALFHVHRDRPFEIVPDWKRRHAGVTRGIKCRGFILPEYPNHRWFNDVEDNGQRGEPKGLVPVRDNYVPPRIPMFEEFNLNLAIAVVPAGKVLRSARVCSGNGTKCGRHLDGEHGILTGTARCKSTPRPSPIRV